MARTVIVTTATSLARMTTSDLILAVTLGSAFGRVVTATEVGAVDALVLEPDGAFSILTADKLGDGHALEGPEGRLVRDGRTPVKRPRESVLAG